MQDYKLDQNLQLKQEQILTPMQLQSLEILAAPITELQSKLQNEIETNPVLENMDNINLPNRVDELPMAKLGEQKAESNEDDEFSNIISLAESLKGEDLYQHHIDGKSEEEKYEYLFNSIIAEKGLEERLIEQLSFFDINEKFKSLCKLIIGSIDKKGFFSTSLKDLALIAGVDVDEMGKALEFIQNNLEPPGIGARDIKESLILQLKRANRLDHILEKIITHHLDDIAKNRLPKIASKLKIPMEKLYDAISIIKSLKPFPYLEGNEDKNYNIVPEIMVIKDGDEYKVILKNEYMPSLKISQKYLAMAEEPNTPKEVKNYIKRKILRANDIIKSIEQRQETIKKIAELIVENQYDFFENGMEYLRPLTMKEIADKIGIHETTVSRAVSKKYMETPQGIFEMKFFFSTGFQTGDGEIISNKGVMEKIKNIIENEDKKNPLSDEAISKILKKDGLQVARRTVAKYREDLGIPSSRERKDYK